jgi:TonB-dependent SusC/RagA subfamily outer membrane receptor
MKKNSYTLIIALLASITSFGQTEKEISSTIEKVTVFTQGAQIENVATVALQPGQMTIKLTGLSPYLKKESVRVEGDGSFTILNVQSQIDYLNEKENDSEMAGLEARVEELKQKVEDEETAIKIQRDKLEFLTVNREIAGKDQALNPETFKTLLTLYAENVEALNLNILKRQRQISGYQTNLKKLQSQIGMLNMETDDVTGTILVTIETKQVKTTKLRFMYRVDQASWYPSYDIRFNGLNMPLSILYKANIRQKTGVDWKNVNLVLSTAKTNVSAQIPGFEPFYLQFYVPRVADMLQGRVAGLAVTENKAGFDADTLVRIRGLSSVRNQTVLYVVDGIPQSDISDLSPDDIQQMEVLKDAAATSIYGSRAANGVVVITTKKRKESSIPLTITSRRETSDEYSIESAQTIVSNNKPVTISYKEPEILAFFEYKSIPVQSENVFLIGRIPDWYKADFLSGEANIYLENAFVGKSHINSDEVKDTLEISFGTDNRINIKRERLPEFSENQFVGPNRKESIGYRIMVRNNKSYAVTVKVVDQIPVSTNKEIQVDVLDLSGGILDKENGKVSWEVKLNPNESEDLLIKYAVKYPKEKRVILE